jgi:hypothetical protein
MKILLRITLLIFAATLILPFTNETHAQRKHPAYLHALSDLRFARSLLERPNGGELKEQEREAIHKIDDAIGEIKRASIDDGKDIADHAPVDPHLPWIGRLHKAKELIDDARHDCRKEEDNPGTQGLQMRVLRHLDEADRHVSEAIAIVDHR